MASVIIHDHVASLGESTGKFPKARVPELLEIISREIPYESVKNRFRERVSPCVDVLGLLAALVLPGAVIQSAMPRYCARLPSLRKRSMVPISPAKSEVPIGSYSVMNRNSLAIVDLSATSALLTSNALIVSSSSKIRRASCWIISLTHSTLDS
jgi:hypothetical protein